MGEPPAPALLPWLENQSVLSRLFWTSPWAPEIFKKNLFVYFYLFFLDHWLASNLRRI
jgi:hypothetical protein